MGRGALKLLAVLACVGCGASSGNPLASGQDLPAGGPGSPDVPGVGGAGGGEVLAGTPQPDAGPVAQPPTGPPCVRVAPQDLDFRQVLVGGRQDLIVEISNCGDVDLQIDRLELVEGSSDDFAITQGLPGLSDACLGGGAESCVGSQVLAGGEAGTVVVR